MGTATEQTAGSAGTAAEQTVEFDYSKLLERAEALIPTEVKKDVRFKLPAPEVSIQGNRTFFNNIKEISTQCDRDPEHILKFFVHELATSGYMERGAAVFTGKFGFPVIKQKLEGYVKEFVLCHECGKPDTKLFKEQRMPGMKCMACGARHAVRSL